MIISGLGSTLPIAADKEFILPRYFSTDHPDD
jgi:hypothetical protein